MKGDFTRFTFDRRKHYTAVLKQQGRVDLDADWNEQQEIDRHLSVTAAADQIGSAGGPRLGAGFLIDEASQSLKIRAGRYYVHGILCENEQDVSIDAQPDLPPGEVVRLEDGTGAPLPPAPGLYLAYLDVWSRHVTALEDPAIREKGLGGPDTATRSKTVWQVRLARVGNADASVNCLSSFPALDRITEPSSGMLAARARPGDGSEDPCIVAAGAGYRRLENQHYRVEIHKGGKIPGVTFKWSRDNGSVMTAWTGKSGNDLTVAGSGRDSILGFAAGQWVELIDDGREQTGRPGTLVRLAKVEGHVLTIDPATATDTVALADFPSTPRIRRWDSVGEVSASVPAANDGYLPLEDGVEIRFSATGVYHTGDWWSIPARTTGEIEWPLDASAQPVALEPRGVRHAFARLALVAWDGTAWTRKSDCRALFPSMTELVALSYAGGDGQEAMPVTGSPGTLLPLARPLSVGVSNGGTPVEGASVRFVVTLGSGRLQGSGSTVVARTNAAGIATCTWELDGATPSQQVTATLLNAASSPVHLPVLFNARLSRADRVSYNPSSSPELAGALTVQAAIDRLSQIGGGGGCATYTISPDGDWPAVLNEIGDGEDAHVCFQRGEFRTAVPIVLSGKGRLKITGCGTATRIVATGAETALRIEGSPSVEVSDLHLESHRTGSQGDNGHINGTLTILDCDSVRIQDLSVKCAGGTYLQASCITVRCHNEADATTLRHTESVRIRGCDLTVGHFQTGILVVDADHAVIEDNRMAVARKSGALGFGKLMEDKSRRRLLARQIVARPLFQEAAPTGQSSTNTTIKLGAHTIRLNSAIPEAEWEKLFAANPPTSVDKADLSTMSRYAESIIDRVASRQLTFAAFDRLVQNFTKSIGQQTFDSISAGPAGQTVLRNLMVTGKAVVLDAAGLAAESRSIFVNRGNARLWFNSILTQQEWKHLLTDHPPEGVTSNVDLLRHVQGLANRLIHDEGLRSKYGSATAWYSKLADTNQAVARHGIVCGGRLSRNIRVIGNRIDGVLEGIHVGFRHRAKPGGPFDTGGQVTIASNDISMRLPMEMQRGHRSIFVGNVHHIVVENNRMTVPAAKGDDRLFKEGIRIFGFLGRIMIVRANMLESCFAGIRVEALPSPYGSNLWLVEDNMAPLAPPVVNASAGVVERNNFS